MPAAVHYEEYLIWGLLALVLGYIVYSFFVGTKEWFAMPPNCTWADPVSNPIPSTGINDFLSGYEYSTSNAAQAECIENPACMGVIGMTSTVNISDSSSRGFHTEPRTFWKLSSSTTMVNNSDGTIRYIALNCSGGRGGSGIISPTCAFDMSGQSNKMPTGNTIGNQQVTLQDAMVACSAISRCEGVFVNPSDGLFYMSDSITLRNAPGYVFYTKISCPDGWSANISGSAAPGMPPWSGVDSHVRNIPPIGAPPHEATSTLGNISGMSGMTGTCAAPTEDVFSNANWASPGDSYILKSSLVPCTCTKHSMGCERHAGGRQESFAPGDLDTVGGDGSVSGGSGNLQFRTEPQSRVMRPFSQAFENQGEPIGFLNSFSAFS